MHSNPQNEDLEVVPLFTQAFVGNLASWSRNGWVLSFAKTK
jgi:hypothetical protein